MNRYIIALFCLFSPLLSMAQIESFEQYRNEQKKKFDAYSQQYKTDFEEYRIKHNTEFANYLGKKWEKIEIEEAVKAPIPKPIDPQAIQPKGEPICIKVPKTIPLPKAPKPIDLTVVKPPKQESELTFSFDFYGLDIFVRVDENYAFKMSEADEKEVQKYWNKISDLKNQDVLDDCVRYRKELSLPDWGYVQLLNRLTTAYYGGEEKNESVFLQGYILTQSGYDIRYISSGDQLILGAAIDCPLFGVNYVVVNNKRYYLINYQGKGSAFYTFKDSFSKESHSFSMVINNEMMQFPFKESTPAKYAARDYTDLKVETSVNLNLIDFYNDYPQCEWSVYARCPMTSKLQQKVLPPLRDRIKGKTEKESADILINFVQTAFSYQTDQDQFGYEKPFFIDEIFYYPASDCEDRSILFSYLVRELMDLNVVLLQYPNHLCTAVLFNDDIVGDALIIDNKRYMICDPTFIGANIGLVHDDYKSVKPNVFTID